MSSEIPGELACIACDASHPLEHPSPRCGCGDLLEVRHPGVPDGFRTTAFQRRSSDVAADTSGVWRFREMVLDLPPGEIVTRGEGGTHLYPVPELAAWTGVADLRLKHEGENPTGSFKDRGMTVAVTMAKRLGRTAVACASTGNTSASMASYAAIAGMDAFVFIPAGKISQGKLSQALAYEGKTLQLAGDFDAAMRQVRTVCEETGIYLVNSINPFRIEGQKTIMFELLEQLAWDPPDWVVVPGGNLGNSSAFGKAFRELHAAGLIPRVPRLAVVQAAGANPFYTMMKEGADAPTPVKAETIATAIRIGDPVSWKKARRAVRETAGVVTEVTDAEIMEAKAHVDRAGVGAEPASCASVAGLRRLVREGVVDPGSRVAAVLTGHLLKDPGATVAFHLEGQGPAELANRPVQVEDDADAIRRAVEKLRSR